MARIKVEVLTEITDGDLADLCDAAEVAILDGGGFGWLKPPPRDVMERYWRGVLLVPERDLFVGRLDGTVGGSVQLLRPPRNNEAQARVVAMTTSFVAPWARGHGMARDLIVAAEKAARSHGAWYVNLDVRATQEAAIELYETLGYERWGTNPHYAVVKGRTIPGYYYTKAIRGPRRGRDSS